MKKRNIDIAIIMTYAHNNFEKVTVGTITGSIKANRRNFYYYYDAKEDILNSYLVSYITNKKDSLDFLNKNISKRRMFFCDEVIEDVFNRPTITRMLITHARNINLIHKLNVPYYNLITKNIKLNNRDDHVILKNILEVDISFLIHAIQTIVIIKDNKRKRIIADHFLETIASRIKQNDLEIV